MIFPVVMYGCESWTLKKAECQRSDVFELWFWRTLESPLDSKEIKPVNPKGNQPWIFTVSTNAKTEAPIFWPPDMKSWLWKRPWCNGRLKAGGEVGDRGWGGWIASSVQWTGTWANSICLQWGRPGLDPWVGKIPWRKEWQPTPVILPGESPWTEEPGRL